MTLESSGALTARSNIQILCTILHVEASHQLGTFSIEVGSTTTTHLKRIILGFGTYFPPVNVLPKKCAMCRRMKNTRALKIICYSARMIDINDYLYMLPWSKGSDKLFQTGLNGSFLKSMPNIWIRQAYVQQFDCETITKKTANMFERMKI